jgi:hypothetical protein
MLTDNFSSRSTSLRSASLLVQDHGNPCNGPEI